MCVGLKRVGRNKKCSQLKFYFFSENAKIESVGSVNQGNKKPWPDLKYHRFPFKNQLQLSKILKYACVLKIKVDLYSNKKI